MRKSWFGACRFGLLPSGSLSRRSLRVIPAREVPQKEESRIVSREEALRVTVRGAEGVGEIAEAIEMQRACKTYPHEQGEHGRKEGAIASCERNRDGD